MWNENRAPEIIDPPLCGDESLNKDQILKFVQVGLLCVQEYPTDRPSMSRVVSVLSNDIDIPSPKWVAYFGGGRGFSQFLSLTSSEEAPSPIDLTLSR
jgi:hypothetical protein